MMPETQQEHQKQLISGPLIGNSKKILAVHAITLYMLCSASEVQIEIHWRGCAPARETVAGLALLRFSGSNMAFMAELIRMRSPLASVSTWQQQHTPLFDVLQGTLALFIARVPMA
jgi:hypothetical protein